MLKGAPETFDAAFGLRTLRGDVGDAELLQRSTELRGFAAAGELFFQRPVLVVANENAVTVAVKTEGRAKGTQQAVEQEEIAASVFGEERTFVIRVHQGKTEWIDVTTGVTANGKTEVFGDLQFGDIVVANATESIRSGTAKQAAEKVSIVS